jgi:hypothetical protein
MADGQGETLQQEQISGYELFVGGAGQDTLQLNGSADDYNILPASVDVAKDASGVGGDIDNVVGLQAKNGSGLLFIDSSVETIIYKDGSQTSYGALAAQAQASNASPLSGYAIAADGEGPNLVYTGQTILLNENASDYWLSRDPSTDMLVLRSLSDPDATAEIAVDPQSQSPIFVRFLNGVTANVGDLFEYVNNGGNTFLTTGTPGNDILVPGFSGDQYVTGGGGTDTVYLHGQRSDYNILAVNLAATADHPVIDGYELIPTNGTSNIFIDQSVSYVHLENLTGGPDTLLPFSALYGSYTQHAVLGGVGTSGNDALLSNLGGDQYFTSGGGTDTVFLHGGLNDYAWMSVDLPAANNHPAINGYELVALNSSGNLYIDGQISTVDLAGSQASSGDLQVPVGNIPAYFQQAAAGDVATAANQILVSNVSGDQYFVNDAGFNENDTLAVHGNLNDYTLRYVDLAADADHPAVNGFELVADNGSGNLYFSNDFSDIRFQSGMELQAVVLPFFLHADAALPSDVTIDANSGLAYGLSSGVEYVNATIPYPEFFLTGDTQDYVLVPVNIAAQDGNPAIDGYELVANNASGEIYIDKSIAFVVPTHGDQIGFSDLSKSFTDGTFTPTGGDDNLAVGISGDQYIVGGAGEDTAYIHGNTGDYTIEAVNLAASGSHPAIDGYELLADNGSGNLYIDGSTEMIHFENGQQLALSALPQNIDPFHG